MHNVSEDLFMGMAILLEQGTHISAYGSRKVYFFILLGPWLLMYLIITNAFRGDNITNIFETGANSNI